MHAKLLTIACCSAIGVISLDPTLADPGHDVRAILSNHCFACHGPDDEARRGGLRLDRRESATSTLPSGRRALVPGEPESSEILRRVKAADPAERMPPAEFDRPLSLQQIQQLEDWIAGGGQFSQHWSYRIPTCPTPPQLPDSNWPQNAIDRFILVRLQSEGLSPSPPADRATLIRRLSLDLTGLPPTVTEVDAFLADRDAKAVERLADRLLDEPAFGEHWARKWLDLARYADSAGYADDPPRTIWAYRDWVIRAINDNLPFDEFTIWQLAGDLLDNPTEDQLIATAFHRNTLTNNEGGTNDEEYRNVAIVDRTNTTFAVWMGTTIACAQCHNHKYDPITQQEFFEVFAIFNNSEDHDQRDERPLYEFLSDNVQAERKRVRGEIMAVEQQISQVGDDPEATPPLKQQLENLQKQLPDPCPPRVWGARRDWRRKAGRSASWSRPVLPVRLPLTEHPTGPIRARRRCSLRRPWPVWTPPPWGPESEVSRSRRGWSVRSSCRDSRPSPGGTIVSCMECISIHPFLSHSSRVRLSKSTAKRRCYPTPFSQTGP